MDTAKIKAVKASTEVPAMKEQDMVTIKIDPEMVGKGGIRVNGHMYVGMVTVPKDQAEDLLRIQEEYWETVKKMTDKNIQVRMKNDFQKERLFLADPSENAGKRGWTRDYGLLGQREWSFCSDKFKEHLLAQRKMMYGY